MGKISFSKQRIQRRTRRSAFGSRAPGSSPAPGICARYRALPSAPARPGGPLPSVSQKRCCSKVSLLSRDSPSAKTPAQQLRRGRPARPPASRTTAPRPAPPRVPRRRQARPRGSPPAAPERGRTSDPGQRRPQRFAEVPQRRRPRSPRLALHLLRRTHSPRRPLERSAHAHEPRRKAPTSLAGRSQGRAAQR